LLDGLEVYAELLSTLKIEGTFFVLGELARKLAGPLQNLVAAGHDIASHGWDHARPLTLSPELCAEDLHRSKTEIEDIINVSVQGYRAPCFSLDRPRLDLVQRTGYNYDSSRILFKQHPLYGTLDLTGFTQHSRNIFQRREFFEFQISTLPLASRNIPVSGGGYLRIFPWWLMRSLVLRYLAENEFYVLYIHPFELSTRPSPILPKGTNWRTRCRFQHGRSRVAQRLFSLIELLKANGFTFTTFAKLRATLAQR
jgi:polysaccharide deacetylase family protein (PEP-CTERM system associated)